MAQYKAARGFGLHVGTRGSIVVGIALYTLVRPGIVWIGGYMWYIGVHRGEGGSMYLYTPGLRVYQGVPGCTIVAPFSTLGNDHTWPYTMYRAVMRGTWHGTCMWGCMA